jgi:phosphatidylglycerophosphate synthase
MNNFLNLSLALILLCLALFCFASGYEASFLAWGREITFYLLGMFWHIVAAITDFAGGYLRQLDQIWRVLLGVALLGGAFHCLSNKE